MLFLLLITSYKYKMIKISEILEIGSNKKYIDNLIKECKKENIIPFIGAGMSVPIYELWGDFFNRCV